MANIEEKIENLIKHDIEELGYRLYDVEYAKEGKDYFLRVFIDKETGISLEDCEKVTNSINDILDKADYIKTEYFLEVSSPGIERVLRKDEHFLENIGKEVEIKLFKPFDGEKIITGTLLKYENERVTIDYNSQEKEFDKKEIAQIKTKYNW